MPLDVIGCYVAGVWGVRETGGGEVEKGRLEGTFWGPQGIMEGWGVQGGVRVLQAWEWGKGPSSSSL